MAVSVLIVDDSAMSRKLLARALPRDLETEITEAANGEEALAAWRAQPGAVMFLDLTMPIMDGYTTLEKLRAEGRTGCVVVVSADIQPKAAERVLALGAVAFLKKPVTTEELAMVLQKHGIYSK